MAGSSANVNDFLLGRDTGEGQEDGELVAEGQDLRVEFGPSTETGTGRREEGDEAWTHDS
jgi:hypothetical protein